MSNYRELSDYLNEHDVTLVAVSKTKPEADIMRLYNAGQRIFGENRVQELVEKYEKLPKDIEWHMIGHLQKNKVKYLASLVALVHSCDSLKLIKEINKEAIKAERVIPVLLQIRIAQEETKYGLSPEDAEAMIRDPYFKSLKNIEVKGVMGMATFTDDQDQVRQEFKKLKHTFNNLKQKFFNDNTEFKHISMGMSGDYKIAIEEGSTMVRVGSLLFGARH
jgi:pyridoxal phosphate enzyme (YggS family)